MLATGWQLADLVHIAVAATCLASWYLRSYLKLGLLALISISSMGVYASASLASFGYVSCAIPLFISALMLCSLLFSVRATLVLSALVFLVVIFAGAYFLLLGPSNKAIFSSSHPFINFLIWASTAVTSLLFIPLFADYHYAARKVYLDTLSKTAANGEIKQIDPLTALPALSILMDRLHHEIDRSKRGKTIGAVMCIDVDNFRNINEQFGKEAGDAVLRTLSARISSVVRASDTLSRIGGDEFVAVFPDHENEQQVILVAGKIMSVTEDSIAFGEEKISLQLSIGISLYPEHSLSPRQLLGFAQDACELAKSEGGNRFRITVLEASSEANILAR